LRYRLRSSIPKNAPQALQGEWKSLAAKTVGDFRAGTFADEITNPLLKFHELDAIFTRSAWTRILICKAQGMPKFVLAGFEREAGIAGACPVPDKRSHAREESATVVGIVFARPENVLTYGYPWLLPTTARRSSLYIRSPANRLTWQSKWISRPGVSRLCGYKKTSRADGSRSDAGGSLWQHRSKQFSAYLMPLINPVHRKERWSWTNLLQRSNNEEYTAAHISRARSWRL